MKPHLHFNITDTRWAISIAGAINSARFGINNKINRPFTVSFEPTNPEIAFLAQFYDAKPANAEDYPMPDEAFYPILDFFAAKNHAAALEEQHGIRIEPVAHPTYTNVLASNALLMTHGLVSTPGSFYPEFNKHDLQSISPCDIIVEKKEYSIYATAFCKGAELSCKSIKTIEEIGGDFNAFKMIKAGTSLFVGHSWHPIQHYLHSQYKGFDSLKEIIPILTVMDGTCDPNTNRHLTSFSAQIPVMENEIPAVAEQRGKVWRLRYNYDFDHRKFFKDNPQEAY